MNSNGEYYSYKETDAAGVLVYRAVVRGTNPGECKKPGAANAVGFIGITQQAQATQNKPVNVKTRGRTFGVAAGAIAYGDAVNIADNTGKLQSCQADYIAAPGVAKTLNIVGFANTPATNDGDMFELDLQPFCVKTAAS